jgi:hypothetical protein
MAGGRRLIAKAVMPQVLGCGQEQLEISMGGFLSFDPVMMILTPQRTTRAPDRS